MIDLLQAFRPARNHLVELDLERTPLRGAVEYCAIDELARVLHLHRVSRGRIGTLARLDDLIPQAAWQLHDILAFLELVEKRLRFVVVLFAKLREEDVLFLLHERIQLRADLVEIVGRLVAGCSHHQPPHDGVGLLLRESQFGEAKAFADNPAIRLQNLLLRERWLRHWCGHEDSAVGSRRRRFLPGNLGLGILRGDRCDQAQAEQAGRNDVETFHRYSG